jgi:hypothetical protein
MKKQLQLGLAGFALLIAGFASAQSNDRHNRQIEITNLTNVALLEVYASNVGTKDWQEDVLGEDVIHPGQKFRFNIDDGTGYCKYDFKLVFEDGDELFREGYNVCEEVGFTIE